METKMSPAEKRDLRMTPSEYALWEQAQPERHEYYRGEVFSQAGGSRNHSLIGTNAASTIGQLLKGHRCQAHGSDMRIHIEATGYQAYPDVSVVCPPVEGDSEYVISNPVLVIEVLSPVTTDFDRGTKFGHYRQIPSLKEYLVFWQDAVRVEQHTRTPEGLWLLRELEGLDAILHLASLDKPLALRDVYDKVDHSSC
jgi:Uma2 family endonuclease